jgi:hypothetical protein
MTLYFLPSLIPELRLSGVLSLSLTGGDSRIFDSDIGQITSVGKEVLSKGRRVR